MEQPTLVQPPPLPTKPRRGRPPRVSFAPEQQEFRAPIAVTIRFKAGAVDTFGCSSRTIQGNFIVFSMPEAGGFLQKNIYVSLSEIASMTIVESPQMQAPAFMPQAPVMQYQHPPAAPPRPTGPVVYEARKELATRQTALGPVSEVEAEGGGLTVVPAGFMA